MVNKHEQRNFPLVCLVTGSRIPQSEVITLLSPPASLYVRVGRGEKSKELTFRSTCSFDTALVYTQQVSQIVRKRVLLLFEVVLSCFQEKSDRKVETFAMVSAELSTYIATVNPPTFPVTRGLSRLAGGQTGGHTAAQLLLMETLGTTCCCLLSSRAANQNILSKCFPAGLTC